MSYEVLIIQRIIIDFSSLWLLDSFLPDPNPPHQLKRFDRRVEGFSLHVSTQPFITPVRFVRPVLVVPVPVLRRR